VVRGRSWSGTYRGGGGGRGRGGARGDHGGVEFGGWREREREREAGAARQWQLAASSSLYGLTRRRWQRGEECGWRLRGA